MNFKAKYNRQNFLKFLEKDFLGEKFEEKNDETKFSSPILTKITKLGFVYEFDDLVVLEVEHKSKKDARITLTKEIFKLLNQNEFDGKWRKNALVILINPETENYRFSLLTTTYDLTEKGIKTNISNPKRFSFLLGPDEKVKTAKEYLQDKGKVNSFKDLKDRFNVEVVRKEFFNQYLELYVRLYIEIKKDTEFCDLLKKQQVDLVNFTKNLIGKIVFLYFIQKKGWLGVKNLGTYGKDGNTDFMRSIWEDFQNGEIEVLERKDYFYNDYLEWLFYGGLNKDNRDTEDFNEYFNKKLPYLNGGLFKEDYKGWRDFVVKISNGIFSNGEGTGILDTFDTYNFTIDEDDLYDREIAIDPEMLGKIFEKMISISEKNIEEVVEIYQNTTRKSLKIDNELNKKLGAFYTPREIVHYMTKESLINYLVNGLKGKREDKDKKVRKLFEIKDEFLLTKQEITEEVFDELAEIIEDVDVLLKKVKILDPAVGSGAFPMGLLHEISTIMYYIYKVFGGLGVYYVDAEFKKDGDISMYEIKRKIIEDNIYGVDISPGAIDIARLRFWLSLVIDEDLPEPLPNFEFKFVCANTLVPLKRESGIFDQKDLEEKLREKMNKYYNSQTNKGNDGKETLEKEIKELLRIEQTNLEFISEKEKQLTSFNPFQNKRNADFFDFNLMFGIRRGEKFDIVIGNPPYLQLQKLKDNPIQKIYKNLNFKTYDGYGDLYCLFYEKGISFLKEGGNLCFITSNKWMRAGYGESLRGFLAQNNPKILIDLGGNVFENATVDTNILLIEKSTNIGKTMSYSIKGNEKKEIDLEKEKGEIMSFVDEKAWVILTPIERSIKEKIEKVGTPLKDWDIKINRGILTGCNEAFIIDGNKKNELIKKDPKSAEIIRPILRGKDIKRYGYEFADLWLIATFPSKHYNIDDFLAIKEYLLEFGYDRLKQTGDKGARKKTNNKWFEIQDSIAYREDFSKQKIIYSETNNSDETKICLDENSSYFTDKTCFILLGKKENITHHIYKLMGSNIFTWYMKSISPLLGEKGISLTKESVEKFPACPIDKGYDFTEEEMNFISSSVSQ